MNETENNKLIAEFMGLIVVFGDMTLPNGEGKLQSLKYHTSWDWLMPVVGKISEVAAGGISYDVQKTLLVADIEKTHKAIVEFIKWYNKQ